MKLRVASLLLCCLFFVGLLTGCGSTPGSIKPCFMVYDTLYYQGSGTSVDSLPDGYKLAGALKRVNYIPKTNFTGCNCLEGSEIYYCEASPDTAYMYVSSSKSYLCFTVEKLQYDYVMIEDVLYIREDNYFTAYEISADTDYGDFSGELPEDCKKLGTIDSSVSDALPTANFQTNFQNFIGYSVYTSETHNGVVYLVSDPSKLNGIRFIKCVE